MDSQIGFPLALPELRALIIEEYFLGVIKFPLSALFLELCDCL
jgi:hypothetical protein